MELNRLKKKEKKKDRFNLTCYLSNLVFSHCAKLNGCWLFNWQAQEWYLSSHLTAHQKANMHIFQNLKLFLSNVLYLSMYDLKKNRTKKTKHKHVEKCSQAWTQRDTPLH